MQDSTPKKPEERKVTITLNRDNAVNVLLAAQLVLLVVFGWQLQSLKSDVGHLASTGSQQVAQNAQAAAPTPTTTQPSTDTGTTAPVNITVTAADHVLGNPNAKVTIVEYSDFQCPYCGAAYPTVKQVMSTYGDKVRLVYRHFPLSFHPWAEKAAEAAECASDQGKFWEMHDKMFENQDNLAVDQLKKFASDLGLNTSKFNSCLDSGQKANLVQADETQGSTYGVNGTPGFFINGISLVGAQPFSAFKQIIDQQLAS